MNNLTILADAAFAVSLNEEAGAWLRWSAERVGLALDRVHDWLGVLLAR